MAKADFDLIMTTGSMLNSIGFKVVAPSPMLGNIDLQAAASGLLLGSIDLQAAASGLLLGNIDLQAAASGLLLGSIDLQAAASGLLLGNIGTTAPCKRYPLESRPIKHKTTTFLSLSTHSEQLILALIQSMTKINIGGHIYL